MTLGDGCLRMSSQNGDPELGKYGPHHFHKLCTHISHIMQKTKKQKTNKKKKKNNFS